MSGTEGENSSENDNLCVVCFKTVEIYSIGPCDHAVCFECSTRMRVLCKQNECPICRQLISKVLFTKYIESYSMLFPKFEQSNLQDRKVGIIFCTSDIQKAYYRLLEHRCSLCEENERKWPFKTFQQLKDHMRREHELFYCDICTENLKIFSFEKRCYNRQELGLHRRKGDPDNTSHRGHPLCEFCDDRFMDNEELFRHLRRNHLFCHFCDADGKHQFYNNIDDLVRHFRDEHYLCEEGECKGMPLTAVFRTDIDCKAHKATEHSRFMSKSGAKQARTLELEFTLAPRARPGHDMRNRRYNDRRDRMEEDTYSNTYHMEPGGPGGGMDEDRGRIFVNPLTPQDFPALGGASSNITVHTRPASVNFTSKMNSNFSSEDFPSLGGSGPINNNSIKPSSAVTITTNSSARNSRASEVTITRVPGGQKRYAKTLENFPALGGPSSSGGGTARLSVSNSEESNTPKMLSIQVNHRPNSNITTHITASVSSCSQSRPSEAFPALVAITAVQPKWVPAKKKKEPKAVKVAPAPQLPPTSLEQFPTLAKKKSSVSVPVSNNWVNLNDINSSNYKSNSNNNVKTNGNNDNSRNGSDSSSKKSDGGKLASTKQKNNFETKFNNLKLNENNDSKNKNKKKKGKLTETDLYKFDNPSKSEETNNNNEPNNSITTNGMVKKRSELKIGTLNSPTETVIPNDFPSLGQTKPPPGFSIKPPPGLSPASFPALGASDFTFTSSSGQSYSIMPANSYHQPANFHSRNQDLIKRFMTILDNDAIKEFKTYSDLFRNGAYPTNKYYEHCREVLRDKFDEVFPELLVLLPDLEKQQELYKVYDGKSKKNLVVCENCKQIIFKKELSEHYNNHVLENQFPTLGKAQQSNNAWRK